MNLEALSAYKSKADFIEDVKKRTFESEMKYHGCAQVIVQTFLDVLKEDNIAVSMASSPFAAGLALTGNNCGAVIGGLMSLGLVFGRKDITEGMDGIVAGIRPMRKLVKTFQGERKYLDCRDITQTDLADPHKASTYFDAGGLEKCANMMADVAAFVADVIYDEYTKGQQPE